MKLSTILNNVFFDDDITFERHINLMRSVHQEMYAQAHTQRHEYFIDELMPIFTTYVVSPLQVDSFHKKKCRFNPAYSLFPIIMNVARQFHDAMDVRTARSILRHMPTSLRCHVASYLIPARLTRVEESIIHNNNEASVLLLTQYHAMGGLMADLENLVQESFEDYYRWYRPRFLFIAAYEHWYRPSFHNTTDLLRYIKMDCDQLEKELICEIRYRRKMGRLSEQMSSEEYDPILPFESQEEDLQTQFVDFFDQLKNYIAPLLEMCSSYSEHFPMLKPARLEGFIFSMVVVFQTDSLTKFIPALLAAVSHWCDRSMTGWVLDKIKSLSLDMLESADLHDQGSFRDAITAWERMADSVILEKLRELMCFCLTFGTLESFGLSDDTASIVYGEFKAQKRHKSVTSFALAFCDVVEFVFSRLGACVSEGSLTPIIHNPNHYTTWFDDCARFIEWHSMFNLDPLVRQFKDQQFDELGRSCISRGEEYVKFAKNVKERRELNALISKIKLIHGEFMTREIVGQPRMAPFTVLLSGDSSIGKSSIVVILRTVFAAITNLPNDPRFFYTRNFSDQFWSGFKTHMWFLLLDDIATTSPNILREVDISISESFIIGGNFSFTANMPDLESKGKVAIRPEFVVATTNVPDLNAAFMFSCPSAARRRFPWRITPVLKEKYRLRGENILDPTTVDNKDGEFPDLWTFTVENILPVPLRDSSGKKNTHADERMILENVDLPTLLDWFVETALKYRESQKKMVEREHKLLTITFCDHRVPAYLCRKCKMHEQGDLSFYFGFTFLLLLSTACILLVVHQCEKVFMRVLMKFSEVSDNKLLELDARLAETKHDIQALSSQVVSKVAEAVETLPGAKFLRFCDDPIGKTFGKKKEELLPPLDVEEDNDERSDEDLLRDLKKETLSDMGRRAMNFLHQNRFGGAIAALLGAIAVFKLSQRLLHNQIKFVKPVPVDEKARVEWVAKMPDFNSDALSRTTKSWKAMDLNTLQRIIGQNVVHLTFSSPNGSTYKCNGFFGHSFDLILNTHDFDRIPDRCDLKILSGPERSWERNITTFFDKNDDYIYRHLDVTIISFGHLGLFRNLKELFPREPLRGSFSGFYIRRNENGDLETIDVSSAKYRDSWKNKDLKTGKVSTYDLYMGCVDGNTPDGLCGAPLVLMTEQGPVIAGIHSIGGAHSLCGASIVKPNWFTSGGFHLGDVSIGESNLGSQMRVNNNKILVEPVSLSPSLRTKDPLLHRDKVVNYCEAGRVFGSLGTGPSKMKSKVRDTYVRPFFEEKGFETDCVAPIFDARLWHNALNDMAEPTHGISEAQIKFVCSNILETFWDRMTVSDMAKMEFYDAETALLGADGVNYVDSMNMKTSMGYPLKKPKNKFFILEDGKYSVPQEVLDQMEIINRKAERGERSNPVFSASAKDEPRPRDKVEKGNIRVFCGSPVAYNAVMRQHFLGYIRAVQSNPTKFETSIGINAHSKEWDNLARFLQSFGLNIIDGDHKKFDKRMSACLIYNLFQIVIELIIRSQLKMGTLEPEEVEGVRLKLQTLAIDTAFAFIDFNGTLMDFLKNHCSGNILTLIINSLANSAYLRIAYMEAIPEDCQLVNFSKHVGLISFGDDFLAAIADAIKDRFNFRIIQRILGEKGIEITPANKTTEIPLFSRLEDVEFLKRRFVFSQDLDRWVAPLNIKSIHRSLLISISSDAISREEQSLYAMISAHQEMFFHGRQEFEGFRKLVDECIERYAMKPLVNKKMFPSYEDFLSMYKKLDVVNFSSFYEPVQYPEDLYEQLVSLDPAIQYQKTTPSLPTKQEEKNINSANNLNTLTRVEQPTSTTNEIVEGRSQPCVITELYEQGDFVEFVDQGDPVVTSFAGPMDPTCDDKLTAGEFSEFLKRPVPILTVTWNEGDFLDLTFFPWHLWANSATIKTKLHNFSLFRGNLKIKALVNAAPMYFGAARLGYEPLYGALKGETAGGKTVSYTGWRVAKSQYKGIDLYPQYCQGGEFEVPFMYPNPWVRMTEAASMTALGRCSLFSYTALANANSVVTSAVTITIIAWCDNAEVSGPTSSLAMQGYEEGPISGPASAVADAAGALARIPIFKPYALGTQMVASSVGKVAKYFGFTNTPTLENQRTFHPGSHYGMASTEISTPYEKLALDDQNELSIDPRIAGLPPTDEMTIESIISRESFLFSSVWSAADLQDKILFQSYVLPGLMRFTYDITNVKFTINGTPLSHIARLFNNWRGSIIFRFKFVCTTFHKGRVRITWDPAQIHNSTTNTIGMMTTSFTKILDLSENDECEIEVPYMQAPAYLATYAVDAVPFQAFGITLPTFTDWLAYANGAITVSVLNVQTSPMTSSDITMLTYVRAGKDFVFANPRDPPKNFTCLDQQMEVSETPTIDFAYDGNHGDLSKVHMGESVVSVRQLLHRKNYYQTLAGTASAIPNSAQTIVKWDIPRVPLPYGYSDTSKNNFAYANGTVDPATKYPVNYAPNSTFTHIAPLFVGARGSIVYTLNYSSPRVPAMMSMARSQSVQADYSGTQVGFCVPNVTAVSAAPKQGYYTVNKSLLSTGPSGRVLTNPQTQAGLSAHYPMYSALRLTSPTGYMLSKESPGLATPIPVGEKSWGVEIALALNTFITAESTLEKATLVDVYYMAGHDFTFLYFNCVPTMYSYTLPLSTY